MNIVIGLIGMIVGIGGFILLYNFTSWQVTLAIFMILFGNNWMIANEARQVRDDSLRILLRSK